MISILSYNPRIKIRRIGVILGRVLKTKEIKEKNYGFKKVVSLPRARTSAGLFTILRIFDNKKRQNFSKLKKLVQQTPPYIQLILLLDRLFKRNKSMSFRRIWSSADYMFWRICNSGLHRWKIISSVKEEAHTLRKANLLLIKLEGFIKSKNAAIVRTSLIAIESYSSYDSRRRLIRGLFKLSKIVEKREEIAGVEFFMYLSKHLNSEKSLFQSISSRVCRERRVRRYYKSSRQIENNQERGSFIKTDSSLSVKTIRIIKSIVK